MTEFFSAYIVGDAPLDMIAGAELAQPTGETVTRKNPRKAYTAVLDEDGNPTGEQVFEGYEYFDEDVEDLRGGWILEADGTVTDAGIISNTLHGLFSTHSDNVASNIDIYPANGHIIPGA